MKNFAQLFTVEYNFKAHRVV